MAPGAAYSTLPAFISGYKDLLYFTARFINGNWSAKAFMYPLVSVPFKPNVAPWPNSWIKLLTASS
jgi:hypothetical protein